MKKLKASKHLKFNSQNFCTASLHVWCSACQLIRIKGNNWESPCLDMGLDVLIGIRRFWAFTGHYIIDFNKSGVKGLPKEVLLQGKTPGSGWVSEPICEHAAEHESDPFRIHTTLHDYIVVSHFNLVTSSPLGGSTLQQRVLHHSAMVI